VQCIHGSTTLLMGSACDKLLAATAAESYGQQHWSTTAKSF
jgi:hypothetical protein